MEQIKAPPQRLTIAQSCHFPPGSPDHTWQTTGMQVLISGEFHVLVNKGIAQSCHFGNERVNDWFQSTYIVKNQNLMPC